MRFKSQDSAVTMLVLGYNQNFDRQYDLATNSTRVKLGFVMAPRTSLEWVPPKSNYKIQGELLYLHTCKSYN